MRHPYRIPLVVAAAVAATLAMTGCGILGGGGPGPRAADRLPDLPRASRTLPPGGTVTFRGLTVVYEGREERDGEAGARLALGTGRDSTGESAWVAFGEAIQRNDILVQVDSTNPRARASLPGAGSQVAFTFFHLPSMARGGALESRRELSMTPGEIRFFGDSYLRLGNVFDNDGLRNDDDGARITVGTAGGSEESADLMEGETRRMGGLTVFVRDVFPGDFPGDEVAVIELAPEGKWTEPPVESGGLLASPGEASEWEGLEVIAEPYESRLSGPSAFLTLRHGGEVYSRALALGEAVRWGRWGVSLVATRGDTAELEAARFETSYAPTDRRSLRGASPMDAPDEREPAELATGRIARRVVPGSPIEFRGLTVELLRTFHVRRDNLNDDMGEFRFQHARGQEVRRLTEGWRDTVYGDNQWWVVKVVSVTPHDNPERAHAEIEIEAGSFFRGTGAE